MSLSDYRFGTVCALLSALIVLSGCSSGSNLPQPGTPAFYWQAAQETFAAGDFTKTETALDNILASDNEFTARALPWSLVLTSGMAAGYREMADTYTSGARANRSDPSAFRTQASNHRAFANRLALHFAENFAQMDKLKDANVALAFGLPPGNAAEVVEFAKLGTGRVLTPAEVDSMQKRAIERGVLLAACSAAGAPDDPAKTEAILKAPNAQVARATFIFAMAQALYNQSQLYTRDKLDDPDKVTLFCQRAQNALKTVPESKDTKALMTKIQTTLKKGKKA
jgi:hypothetical protein